MIGTTWVTLRLLGFTVAEVVVVQGNEDQDDDGRPEVAVVNDTNLVQFDDD